MLTNTVRGDIHVDMTTHERCTFSHAGLSELYVWVRKYLHLFLIKLPSYTRVNKSVWGMLLEWWTFRILEFNNLNNAHLYVFCPRNRWRVSSSLLWPGALRSQLWGDEEGGVRWSAEAQSAQPTPVPPSKASTVHLRACGLAARWLTLASVFL